MAGHAIHNRRRHRIPLEPADQREVIGARWIQRWVIAGIHRANQAVERAGIGEGSKTREDGPARQERSRLINAAVGSIAMW